MVFGYILHTRKKHLIKSSHREKIEQNKQKKKRKKETDGSKQEQEKTKSTNK